MEDALFWNSSDEQAVDCRLCPHNCHIRPGKVGICRVRKNEEGRLYSLNYGRCSSIALDPTEKKPLYHFCPGSFLFSIGTVGCNLRCGFCQNWTISQEVESPTREASPEQIVEAAMRSRSEDPRTVGIAYTYNEPLMWYEFVRDTSRLAKQKGLQNVLVTNGFIQEEPLRDILPQIDAMNIDVKGFTDQYYRKICSGQLEPVLRTVEMSHKSGCHIEITTVIVPELNDSEEEIDALTTWVASIDRNIPVHFSRYFPNYKFNTPPTPPATLMKAREIARRRLNYVYLGNLWGATGSDTTCPKCGKVVIERSAMEVTSVSLDHGRCPSCGEEIRIRGEVFKPEGE